MRNNYSVIVPFTKLDDVSQNEAYKIFNTYKKNRVIFTNNWDSDVWITNDERQKTNLDFTLKTDQNVVLGISKRKLINYMKIYVCYLFGNIALQTIQGIIRELKILCLENHLDFELQYGLHDDEFFNMLPFENAKLDRLLKYIYEFQDLELEKGTRELCNFESYFRFDDLLDKYWIECKNEEEKLFYFPIYLWWKITTVIPERVTEFILTPRNCLSIKNGKYFIKLRKTILKGKDKPVSYKIEEDYKIVEYQIPLYIGKEIEWYINKTEKLIDSELDTLFVMNTHYRNFGRSPGINNRYLTINNFNTILKNFYIQIVQNYFGYEVIFDRHSRFLNSNQIQYINLGDSRHLALINIIAEGGSPTVAMLLAGHSDINITMSYADNISKMVDCKAYRFLNGISGYKISEPIKRLIPKKYVKIGDTICDSVNTINHDFSDCAKAIGPNGELGYCNNCIHSGKKKPDSDPKTVLEERIKYLMHTVEYVRKGKGCVEDILSEFNKISAAKDSYFQYLKEKKENGKK